MDWGQIVKDGGIVGLLLAIIAAGFTKQWVFGWQYEREVERGDKLERMLDHSLDLTEQIAKDSLKTKGLR